MRYALVLILACMLAALGVVTRGAPAASQPVRTASGAQADPAIAFNGTSYVLAWTDTRGSSGAFAIQGPPPPPPPPPTPRHADIYATRVGPTGKVLDGKGFPVSTAANVIAQPALASGRANSLVVWTDYRLDGRFSAIYGMRLSPAGRLLDPVPIPIETTQSQLSYKTSPSVAFDGQNYLVVWQGYELGRGLGTFAARVTPAGAVLDTPSIPVADGGSEPSVAFDGANYMVVLWTYDYPGGRIVRVVRVRPSGAVLDQGIPVAEVPQAVPGPAIAFNGSNYLVTWIGGSTFANTVDAARVSSSGTVLDPGGIAIASAGDELFDLAAGSDGTNYLVAWADSRSGCCSIYGARVSAGGAVLDPAGVVISMSGSGKGDPAIAYGGSSYLVAWTDNRADSGDVYGARMTRAGGLLDPQGIPLSTFVPPPPPVRCKVPRVVGLRLSLAKKRIRRARCSVGAVRRKRSARAGIVLGQKPRARSIRRQGFRVTLVVGRR